ncbi:tyrosine-type recombinase/integrase [Paracoccus onubensis]|uniref:tyrosine-type recombinase/integrase n=1 Tax=Paracoccus onubensis TaxID=1675788 RepID=UPI00272F749A|nr:tyrosine-type recombinase/integrase [Paracoccus onubensis]MDP0925683.1 tyrosine-type recombinase/integrase [Paracoccus onubensis]
MAGGKLTGIHRVKKRMASGRIRQYHYAYRGGPMFWNSDMPHAEGSPKYVADLSRHQGPVRSAGKFRMLIVRYLESGAYAKLAPRTKSDESKYITPIDKKFGDAPISILNSRKIRGVAMKWRDENWSGRQADAHMSMLAKLSAFAYDNGMSEYHHLAGIKGVYSVDRSGFIWTDDEIERTIRIASAPVQRAIIIASETGLAPVDMVTLTKGNVSVTPSGRYLRGRRAKTGQPYSIPVTPRLAEVIDSSTDMLILTKIRGGGQWTPRQVSRQITKYAKEAKVNPKLTPYDLRGTAATRLLIAGLKLGDIAAFMGWSLKHASEMIEKYARANPENGAEILLKLARQK